MEIDIKDYNKIVVHCLLAQLCNTVTQGNALPDIGQH
jgi:hypothetical protein